jgi:hypothetical protein
VGAVGGLVSGCGNLLRRADQLVGIPCDTVYNLLQLLHEKVEPAAGLPEFVAGRDVQSPG